MFTYYLVKMNTTKYIDKTYNWKRKKVPNLNYILVILDKNCITLNFQNNSWRSFKQQIYYYSKRYYYLNHDFSLVIAKARLCYTTF